MRLWSGGWHAGRFYVLSLAVCVALASCDSELPTEPEDFVGGVIVYEHPAYTGASAYFYRDLDSLSDFTGPCKEPSYSVSPAGGDKDVWNDCISSIRVKPGWRATLYTGYGFDDDHMEVTEDISDLRSVPGPCADGGGGFNDCVSSIRVHRPAVP